MLYITLLALLLIFVISTYFLGVELLKKFKFWKSFQKEYKNQISWVYHGDKTPGMYTLVLEWNQPFRTLIGFDFSLAWIKNIGYDVFGCMESDADGSLYFSVYLGHGPVEFIFLIDSIGGAWELSISCVEDDIHIVPKYRYAPHWWQRIGFFG